jgi:tripartite-type tricarboxylate transporter receptor subunit TctC
VRLLADTLADAFGKPVTVDNLTGAAGNIAADRTAKANPDGYTIGMLTGANIVINVSLYNKLSFDPIKDLAPIAHIYGYPNMLVLNDDVPAKTVGELVALARAKPAHSPLVTRDLALHRICRVKSSKIWRILISRACPIGAHRRSSQTC